MKKLFYIAGLFTGMYLIYIFILFSNSVIFPSIPGKIYDCTTEHSISTTVLADVAEEYDLTVFTSEYYNTTSFFKDIVFRYLSISDEHQDRISMGYQKSLFPSNKILFETQDEKDINLQRFWVVQNQNDRSSFDAFLEALEEYGVHEDHFAPRKMGMAVLFAEKNIKFFVCISLLLLFCIGSYYVIRNKEIAILRLNGYGNLPISIRITRIAAIRIAIGYIITDAAFSIYIAARNPALLLDYIKLICYVAILLAMALTVSCLVGAVFIRFLSIIPALKSNKNNKLILASAVTFKVCVTVILLLFAKNVCYNTLDMQIINQNINTSKGTEFYYIKTSEKPDDVLMGVINSSLNDIDRRDIYNYANPTDCLSGHELLLDHHRRNDMILNPPVIRMSYNMLNIITIYSDSGKVIKENDFDPMFTTILIPVNLKDITDEIVGKFYSDSSIQVYYTAAGQEHINFLNPEETACNAIFCLSPAEDNIYFNNGRVLLHEDDAVRVQKYLDEHKIDSGTVSLFGLSAEYQKIASNKKLMLADDLQFLIVNLASFVLSILAIGIVYCEFRKKEISVYQMLSVYPKRVILYLSGINIAVTLVLSVIICPVACFVVIPEFLIYFGIFNNYRSRKVLSVLKGE